MMDKRELWDRFWSILFPKRCVLCGNPVEYETLWCGTCTLPVNEAGYATIAAGRRAPYRFISPFLYQGGIKAAVIRLKEVPDKRYIDFLTQHMAQKLQEQAPELRPDILVAVPQTDKKCQETGFNHAALLAQRLSGLIEVPLREDILCRIDSGKKQHNLSQQERAENAKRSYQAQRGAALAGQSVLLIDDVLTTGATAAACAVQLLRCGAGEVCVLTAAYTPLEKND